MTLYANRYPLRKYPLGVLLYGFREAFSSRPDRSNRLASSSRMSFGPRPSLDSMTMLWNQRSVDVALGLPFNIASYALLTMMIAQVVGLKPGDFVHTFGDVHIYLNHIEQVKTQLAREPYPLPEMRLNPAVTDLFAFCYEDFELLNYRCHPAIRAPIAV